MRGRRRLDLDGAQAIDGLRAAIETPLGDAVGGIRLRDVRRQDRLDELEFELPLVGGDDPTGQLTLRAIAAALRTHLPDDDPLAGMPRGSRIRRCARASAAFSPGASTW